LTPAIAPLTTKIYIQLQQNNPVLTYIFPFLTLAIAPLTTKIYIQLQQNNLVLTYIFMQIFFHEYQLFFAFQDLGFRISDHIICVAYSD